MRITFVGFWQVFSLLALIASVFTWRQPLMSPLSVAVMAATLIETPFIIHVWRTR